MGILTSSSETAFTQSPATVYDFVTDPRNWPKTYPGSTGIEGVEELPLKVGDVWSEKGQIGAEEQLFTWRLLTAVRPTKFVFQSIGLLGKHLDGTGGWEGIMTISYTFSTPGTGVTLFHRNLSTEVPKFATIPDAILLSHAPSHIDSYHEGVGKLLG
ncbi:SRPBCC family protein [Streptomyces sp. NPDC093544]|uniref:SRPBCC family protein n=1 Tax=Streptomyces sp. NPDC093544 TaxID=3155200 RepID=UPI00342E0771